MIVTAPREVLRQWLCEKIGYVPTPNMTCIGEVRSGKVQAVVGYDHFTGTSCQIHVAGTGKTWMTRDLLFAAFDYPFRELRLKVLLGWTDSSNEEARSLMRRLGFREATRIVGGHPDGDLIIFELHRADCRWLSIGSRLKWAKNLVEA